jgi:hypothetical protein
MAKLKELLKSLLSKLTAEFGTLWATGKPFVFIFGVVLALIKFHSELIGILVWSSKNLFNSTSVETNILQKQENTNDTKADQLVDNASKLPDSEKPVTDDWNLGNK